jgi:hypothetical protein
LREVPKDPAKQEKIIVGNPEISPKQEMKTER